MQIKTITLFIIMLSFSACHQAIKEAVSQTTEKTNIKTIQPLLDETNLAAETNTYNWLRPPYKKWSIKNVNKLFDTAPILKGDKTKDLEKGSLSLLDLTIEQFDGKTYTFEEHLDSNRTDGFLVLYKGNTIYERYFGNMTETSSHNWFSMSKSLTGTTLAMLAAEGKLDLQKATLEYVPELKGTAWDGTTVQQLMDMTVNIQFDEIYNDPKSDAYKFGRVSGFVEIPNFPSDFDTVLDYFKSVKKGDNHDELFHYVSLNTEVLGMIITKVTGKKPSTVMSEKIWSKLGAEQDAYIVQDLNGHELVSAAINSNLRDAGRFGQMMLNNGYYNGQQIVPKSVIQSIKRGGSIEKFADSKRGRDFKNFSYTNQWWHTDKEAFFAKGLFGQWIYIDPSTELVIVKFTTADIPSSREYDWLNNMNLMRTIVDRIDSMND